jgi:hypothetical protein
VKENIMSLKLKAWQGLLVVIVILGIIGGSLQLAASELQQNLSATAWMGSYQAPFLAFLANSWLIIVVTFIYNIFMYFRQNQLAALKQTTEMFQIQKFTATLAWFIGILGPMAALVSDKQLQAIIAFAIVILTAFVKELENIYNNQTILPPTTSVPQTPAPATPAQQPVVPADAYPVKIGDTFLNADIQALLSKGYKHWYFPDGHTPLIIVPAGEAIGQTLTTVGWVAVLPPNWAPMDTHPPPTG